MGKKLTKFLSLTHNFYPFLALSLNTGYCQHHHGHGTPTSTDISIALLEFIRNLYPFHFSSFLLVTGDRK